MKILNLYAGIGGNRLLWGHHTHSITAVEIDSEIAKVYSELFPYDEVIVRDAHEYLLKHFQDFDFIWSSPPCQSHSQIRFNIGYKADRKYRKVDALYPDMTLYQEIIFLKNWADSMGRKWVVENTIAYYDPLIPATVSGGHLWWSNFPIGHIEHGNRNHRGGTVESLSKRKGIDLSKFDIKNKRQLLRNCVEPEVGKHILDCAKDNILL